MMENVSLVDTLKFLCFMLECTQDRFLSTVEPYLCFIRSENILKCHVAFFMNRVNKTLTMMSSSHLFFLTKHDGFKNNNR